METRIRVFHIIKSLGRGGAEMLLPEALKLHDQKAFEFHVGYFLPWKNQMVESILHNGGKVICFNAGNNIALMAKVFQVVRYVRENKIDVIHAHLPWAGILSRMVGKITGVPVLYTEHNKQERYHVATRTMNLLTMGWLSGVVAVSDDVATSIRKYKPSLRAPLSTILNGVNTNHFQRTSGDAVRQVLGIPAQAPVIGTIAVFRFQKRLDVWIEIAAKIKQQNPDAHFIIVGAGPLEQELKQKRTTMGLDACIHFPGLQTEVRPYLSAFDAYMMSSIFEGLPIALLEAMSMSCAVLSTDAGGIKEVIRHEKDGLLCSVDEPMKLVLLAQELIDDRTKRESLSRQARKRVAESFSMKQMVIQLENLYRKTVQHQRIDN